MSLSLNVRRSVFVIAVVAALVAIPAIASAATGTTTRASLEGAGYCQPFPGGTTPSLGRVQISTSTATAPGFHPVRVDIKVGSNKLEPGDYQVWLVNLYRDDSGQVAGCSASAFAESLTVKQGHGANFRGFVDRYSGEYEVQVYVGPIGGPGYGTAPAALDVP